MRNSNGRRRTVLSAGLALGLATMGIASSASAADDPVVGLVEASSIGGVVLPAGIAVEADGGYVYDAAEKVVLHWSGDLGSALTPVGMDHPVIRLLGVDGTGRLYYGTEDDALAIREPDGATRLITADAGHFDAPADLAFTPDGTRLVAVDTGDQSLSVSDDSGATWRTVTRAEGGFDQPAAVTIANDGAILVGNAGDGSLSRSGDGGWTKILPGAADAATTFGAVAFVDALPDGRILVGNADTMWTSPNGTDGWTGNAFPLDGITSLTVGPDGSVYIGAPEVQSGYVDAATGAALSDTSHQAATVTRYYAPPGSARDTAAAVSGADVAVSWEAPSLSGGAPIEQYRVSWVAGGAPGDEPPVSGGTFVDGTVRNATIAGLADGDYDITVTAFGAGGQSDARTGATVIHGVVTPPTTDPGDGSSGSGSSGSGSGDPAGTAPGTNPGGSSAAGARGPLPGTGQDAGWAVPVVLIAAAVAGAGIVLIVRGRARRKRAHSTTTTTLCLLVAVGLGAALLAPAGTPQAALAAPVPATAVHSSVVPPDQKAAPTCNTDTDCIRFSMDAGLDKRPGTVYLSAYWPAKGQATTWMDTYTAYSGTDTEQRNRALAQLWDIRPVAGGAFVEFVNRLTGGCLGAPAAVDTAVVYLGRMFLMSCGSAETQWRLTPVRGVKGADTWGFMLENPRSKRPLPFVGGCVTTTSFGGPGPHTAALMECASADLNANWQRFTASHVDRPSPAAETELANLALRQADALVASLPTGTPPPQAAQVIGVAVDATETRTGVQATTCGIDEKTALGDNRNSSSSSTRTFTTSASRSVTNTLKVGGKVIAETEANAIITKATFKFEVSTEYSNAWGNSWGTSQTRSYTIPAHEVGWLKLEKIGDLRTGTVTISRFDGRVSWSLQGESFQPSVQETNMAFHSSEKYVACDLRDAIAVPSAGADQPRITGTMSVGSTVSVSNGVWRSTPAPTAFEYQWFHDDGSTSTAIPGATSADYVIDPAYAGQRLSATVWYRPEGYDFGRYQTPETSAVAGLPLTPSRAPAITDVPVAGGTVHADGGAWPPNTTLRYEWYLAGAKASEKNSDSVYLIPDDAAGKSLRVKVYANLPGYTEAQVFSPAMTVGPPS